MDPLPSAVGSDGGDGGGDDGGGDDGGGERCSEVDLGRPESGPRQRPVLEKIVRPSFFVLVQYYSNIECKRRRVRKRSQYQMDVEGGGGREGGKKARY